MMETIPPESSAGWVVDHRFLFFCLFFFVLLDVDWFRFDGIIDRIQILPADKKNDQKKGSMLSVMFLNK